MKVATMFCDPCPEVIVRAMVKSVRQHMDCEIVQLADMTTPKLDCVDSVQRLEGTVVSSFLARHLSQLEGDTLYLDYDTVVREDVSSVFHFDFDLAITKRTRKEIESRPVFMACPHNVGVMFSRSQEFWRQMARRYDSRTDDPTWMKFQIVLTESLNALDFNILELLSERYNYTPETKDEDLSNRAIVHYKGPRKAWMVEQNEQMSALKGTDMVLEMMQGKHTILSVTKDHPYYAELCQP